MDSWRAHPDTVTRIIGAEEKSSLLQARDEPYRLYRSRYLDAIEGLRYGKPKWRKKTYPPYVIHAFHGDGKRDIPLYRPRCVGRRGFGNRR